MCIMLIVHLSQKVDHVNVHLPRWANQLRSLAWMVEQEQTTVTIMGENRHVSKVALSHSTRAESCAAVYENNHTPFPFDPTHSDLFTIDDALICIDSLLQPRTELGRVVQWRSSRPGSRPSRTSRCIGGCACRPQSCAVV